MLRNLLKRLVICLIILPMALTTIVIAEEDCKACATDIAAWNSYDTELRSCFIKCQPNDAACIDKCRAENKNPLVLCKEKGLKDCGNGCDTCVIQEKANNEYIIAQWADNTKCNQLCQKSLEDCDKCANDCTDECKAKYGGKCPEKKECSDKSTECLTQCGQTLKNPFVAPDPADLCSSAGFKDCPKPGGSGVVDCGGGCLAACKKANVKMGSADFMDCAGACKGTDGALIDCANSATNQTCTYDPETKTVDCSSTMYAKALAKKKAKLRADKKANKKTTGSTVPQALQPVSKKDSGSSSN